MIGCLFVYTRPPPMLMRMISHSFALPTLKRAPHPQCRGHYEFNWCLPSPMFVFHTYLYQSFQLWKHRRRPPFLFFVFSCMFALASSGGHYDSIKFLQPRYQEAGWEHFETYRSIDNSALARLKLVTLRPCIGSQHRAHTFISNDERLPACG